MNKEDVTDVEVAFVGDASLVSIATETGAAATRTRGDVSTIDGANDTRLFEISIKDEMVAVDENPMMIEECNKILQATTPPSDGPALDGATTVPVDTSKEVIQQDGDSFDNAKMVTMVKDERKKEEDSTTNTVRHWDLTHRRVVVHNCLKFLDAKSMKRLVNTWMTEMNQQQKNVQGNQDNNPSFSKIDFDKIKKPPCGSWMMLTMKHESMVQPFMDYINNNQITNKRGGILFATLADSRNDQDDEGEFDSPPHRKRRRGNEEDNGDDGSDSRREGSAKGEKRRRGNEIKTQRRPVSEEEVKDKVTALWRLSREEQSQRKMVDMIKKCARKIIQDLKARFRQLDQERGRKRTEVFPWILRKRCIYVEQIVCAPTPLRNKCEFTFGYQYLFPVQDDSNNLDSMDADTNNFKQLANAAANEATVETDLNETDIHKLPSVGFMVTGWAGGVSRPHCCGIVPSEMLSVVDVMNQYLQTSPLPVYDCYTHRGFFRDMTVRISRRTGECMIIIMHCPVHGGVGEKDEPDVYSCHWEAERENLIKLLSNAKLDSPDGILVKVTSVFFREYGGLSIPPPEHPVQHAFGEHALKEKLGRCTFQISPGAFFQVNTEGAEILYQIVVDRVRQVALEPSKAILFDVCCGTGTIGLTIMKELELMKVVGIDISEPAIEDAKKNAILNGFDSDDGTAENHKTRFVAGRAEHVLNKEIQGCLALGATMFVAVVDPAREGLHPDVIKTLRSNEEIQRVVYVSCNPEKSLVRDSILFCSPASKKYSGRPFRISSVSPVDMFPLTDHCEMVMTFDRVSDSDMTS